MTEEYSLPNKPVPAVLWHGSKWRLAKRIIPYFPEHFTYVEPFGGSAAVLLNKAPSPGEVYNDVNRELNNFFTVLRNNPLELAAAVDLTPFSREEYDVSWAGRNSEDVSPLERARRFVVCCYMSRGSIIDRASPTGWRLYAKRSNFGSTPIDVWERVPERLLWVAQRLKKTSLECRPALKVIAAQDSADTLFYCDPPYPPESRSDKQQNYLHDMTIEQHEELLTALMKVKGSVAISSYGHWLYQEMLKDKGWQMITLMTRVQSNDAREEVLWLNPKFCQHSPLLNDKANASQVLMDFSQAQGSLDMGENDLEQDEGPELKAVSGTQKVTRLRKKV